jgi:putative endonuclease
MTVQTKATGRYGERLAEQHFLTLGAKVLERNFHVRYAEVDLLLEHEGDLVAVEVKTRSVVDFVAPEECVYWSQLRRIQRGLMTYAQDNDILDQPMRIDVVLIVLDVDGETVLSFEHLRSVYPG